MKCRNCGMEFPDNLRQCPTCGQQRSEDDLFRRPEEDKAPAPASKADESPAFSFPISRQEPQPSKAGNIPEEEDAEDFEESSSSPEASKPDSKQKKLSWKPWQKITAGALILVLIAVSIFLLWPHSANLPAETLLYKKNGALMAFVPGQEPWTITTEPGNISNYSMKQVPEGHGLIWEHVSTGGLYYQPIGGERVEIAAENSGAPKLSSNGKYIYYETYRDGNTDALHQYRISDGQNRTIMDGGKFDSWYLWQDGSKIVVSLSGTIEIIDAETLGVLWTREGVTYTLPGVYTNALYFLVDRELWCWDSENEKEKKLLDGFMTYYLTEDGALYCQVSIGTQIALSELLENDLPGEEGEALLKQAEGIMVITPESALYYYDGGEPVKLGEDLRLSRVSNSENLLAISIDYAAEYKMPLSEMKESLAMMGGEEDLEAVVVPNWPYEVGTTSLLLQGKTYELTLPEELSGEIAMMENGPWVFPALDEAGISYGIAPFPSDGEYRGLLGGEVIAVIREKNVEGSMEFLKYYGKRETMLNANFTANSLPPRKDVAELFLNVKPEFEVINDQLENCISRTGYAGWTELSSALDDGLYRVLTGEESPEEVCSELRDLTDPSGGAQQ